MNKNQCYLFKQGTPYAKSRKRHPTLSEIIRMCDASYFITRERT
ncbi:MAG: hypothetical protein ACRCZZ_03870 [Phocaeicola sp.]